MVLLTQQEHKEKEKFNVKKIVKAMEQLGPSSHVIRLVHGLKNFLIQVEYLDR